MMNKKTILEALVAILMLLLPTAASAYDIVVDGIYYDLVDGNAVVTNNGQSNCYSGDIVIPGDITHNGQIYLVTAIGENAFMLSSNLTHVTIPHSVTTIGNSAFTKCTALTSVNLPNSVKRIGTYAFAMCGNITSVKIPDSVTAIDQYAFYACTGLETLTVGKSVASIGENAFSACYQMTTLVWNARRCNSTGSLTATGIDSVSIGHEVELLPHGFVKSSRITSIAIPNSVTSIGDEAFFDCTHLTSIDIPDSVTVIRDYTFYGCSSLRSITLGNRVKTVGECAFENCTALTSIDIPNSVTTIQDFAFEGCHRLASVIMGSGVTTIGTCIFYYCDQLTDVACSAITPPSVNNGLFDNMDYYAHATLHVPAESVHAYQAALYWKDFFNIVGDATTYVHGDVNGDGEVNIADANSVTEVIVNGGPGKGHTRVPGDEDFMIYDVNGDGEVNIADINAIIELILSQ